MNAQQLAKPDNGADKTITLSISGNRLVAVLNALDATMYETGRYRFEGDSVVGTSESYQSIRETTEAIRDELSRQRTDSPVPSKSGPMGEVLGATENVGSTTRDSRARPLDEVLGPDENIGS